MTNSVPLPQGILDITFEMQLQEVVPLLDIPETTLHRWIDDLGLAKSVTRDGSRTVCHLPPDTIRRLHAHKLQRGRRGVAANGQARGERPGHAHPADNRSPDESDQAQDLPPQIPPPVQPAPAPPHSDAASPLVTRALQDALDRADSLQAQLDALQARPPAARVQEQPRDPAPQPDVTRYIVIAVVAVARVAGIILYRTYWIVVRVLLPREISRALLGLQKSDYIGWESDTRPPTPDTRGRRRA